MKKALFAAVVTASLICMSLMQVVNAQSVPSTQSFKVRMYIYSWNFNEYDAPTIASHFDMGQSWFATGSNDYTQKMNTVKSLNPNYEALVYRNVHTMDISDPDWNLAKTNGWLVKNANGNYIPGGYSSSLYILDVGNQGYQQWVAAKIKSYLDACPYFDGVMIDGGIIPNAIEFRGWGSVIPINPRTNAPFTDADVRNSYLGLYTAIKNAIGSKIMVANGIWDGQDFYDNYNAYVNLLSSSSLNGPMSEGCWYQGVAWMTESDWLKSLNMVIWMQNNWLQNHPERLFCTTCGAGPQWTMPSGATHEQMMLYGFCSTMLGINYPLQNIMDFAFNGPQSPVPANLMQLEQNLSDLDIGTPLAGYYIVQSHVYTRDFTGGEIMVNPTSTPYTVTLPSTFKTLAGQLVTSITIQPYTGVILTSTTPPTTFGKTNIGAIRASSGGLVIVASRYQLLQSAIITNIEVHIAAQTTAGTVTCGLFADKNGVPGALLAISKPMAMGTSLTWISCPLNSPVNTTAGYYWLAFITNVAMTWTRDAGLANQGCYQWGTPYTLPAALVPNGYEAFQNDLYAT